MITITVATVVQKTPSIKLIFPQILRKRFGLKAEKQYWFLKTFQTLQIT
jgi:hypothetical protein